MREQGILGVGQRPSRGNRVALGKLLTFSQIQFLHVENVNSSRSDALARGALNAAPASGRGISAVTVFPNTPEAAGP